ncbi:MAG: hypothetical protein M3Z49_06530, partial [Bifidobacteriales bacterium]|nr:hypothetical protein [Bifidobacteriales bacterium]
MTTQQLLISIAVLIVLVLAVVGILMAVRKRRSQGDSTRPAGAQEPDDDHSSLSTKSATAVASDTDASTGSVGSVDSEASAQSSSTGQAAPSAQEELAHPEASASRMTRLKARLAKSPNPFGKALFA